MTIFILIAALEAFVFFAWGRYQGVILGKRSGGLANVAMAKIMCDFVRQNDMDEKWIHYLLDGEKASKSKLAGRSTASSQAAK